jgi:hypothetical protein
LCCQATLILPNSHRLYYPLADSNTSIHGPDTVLWSRHLGCIKICDD